MTLWSLLMWKLDLAQQHFLATFVLLKRIKSTACKHPQIFCLKRTFMNKISTFTLKNILTQVTFKWLGGDGVNLTILDNIPIKRKFYPMTTLNPRKWFSVEFESVVGQFYLLQYPKRLYLQMSIFAVQQLSNFKDRPSVEEKVWYSAEVRSHHNQQDTSIINTKK